MCYVIDVMVVYCDRGGYIVVCWYCYFGDIEWVCVIV